MDDSFSDQEYEYLCPESGGPSGPPTGRDFAPGDGSLVAEYVSLFFQMRVEERRLSGLLPGAVSPPAGRNGYGAKKLLRRALDAFPRDAFAVVLVVDAPLYTKSAFAPRRSVSAVCYKYERVSVLSVADPGNAHRGALALVKRVTREVGKFFSLSCPGETCDMHSAGGRGPQPPCPPFFCGGCIRRLQATLGFDPARRAGALDNFTAAFFDGRQTKGLYL